MKRKKLAPILTATVLLGSVLAPVQQTVSAEEVHTEDLLISEYLNGDGNAKAIELFNGTGSDVDLGNYSLEIYKDGSEVATDVIPLDDTLEDGRAAAIANPSDGEVARNALYTSEALTHDGNDTFVLKHGNKVVDSFGQIGNEQGWDTKHVYRDRTILKGDTDPTDAFDLSAEWVPYWYNYYDNLGRHHVIAEDAPAEDTIEQAREEGYYNLVTIEGVITTTNGMTFIQDKTGGILLEGQLGGYDVSVGDYVRVEGRIDSYGYPNIYNYTSSIESKDNPLPEPAAIYNFDKLSPSLAGERVHLYNLTVGEKDEYDRTILNDASGSTIPVNGDSALPELEAGERVDVTAIYRNNGDYQTLYIDKAEDVERHLFIHDVQGEEMTSPYEGKEVEAISGIVTYLDGKGFYMEGEKDRNEITSEGLYVESSVNVSVGDQVYVNGTVQESKVERVQLKRTQTMTQIGNSDVKIVSQDNPLPEALQFGKDTMGKEELEELAMDDMNGLMRQLESVEGMRVSIGNAKVVILPSEMYTK